MSGSSFPGDRWLAAAREAYCLLQNVSLYRSALGGQGVYFMVVAPNSGDAEMATWVGRPPPESSREHFEESLAFARALIGKPSTGGSMFQHGDERGLKGKNHIIVVWGLRDKDLLEGFLALLGIRMLETNLDEARLELTRLGNECMKPLLRLAE